MERGTVTASGLSAKLGRSPGFWSRVLAGELELKVGEVFDVLFHLEVPGDAFFVKHFSPAGPPVKGAPEVGRIAGVCDHWDGEMWCDWAQPQLLDLARSKGLALRSVARALGWPEDSFSRALHGHARLTFGHVFAVLGAVELAPWRFFLRPSVPQRPLVPGVTWDELLDLVSFALEGGRTKPAAAGSGQATGGSFRKG